MNKLPDYYKVLGVAPTASADEIKNAYRNLAHKYHPDKNTDPNAQAIFVIITRAYDVLSDPESRRQYDQSRKQPASEHATSGPEQKAPKKGIVSGILDIIRALFIWGFQKLIGVGVAIVIIWGLAKLLSSNPDVKERPQTGTIQVPESTPIKTTEVPGVDPYAGWERPALKTGRAPECYNYKPRYDKSIDNELRVTVGNNADVVLKLMNKSDNKCVRYVYIRAGDTYSIRNIPQGVYYAKIAYGSNWMQGNVNGKCVGKFTSHALYKKGENMLDYRLIETEYGYQIPSFSLTLDVVITEEGNAYETNRINEDEFNG